MAKRLEVQPHQSIEEVEKAFRAAKDGREKLYWQIILLKKQGGRTCDVARVTGYKPDWVRRVVRDYNANGPDSVGDGRSSNRRERLLNAELMAELRHALEHEKPPGGGVWTGAKVNRWMFERLGQKVASGTAYNYLARLGYTKKTPRPRSEKADLPAQDRFKKKSSRKRSSE